MAKHFPRPTNFLSLKINLIHFLPKIRTMTKLKVFKHEDQIGRDLLSMQKINDPIYRRIRLVNL